MFVPLASPWPTLTIATVRTPEGRPDDLGLSAAPRPIPRNHSLVQRLVDDPGGFAGRDSLLAAGDAALAGAQSSGRRRISRLSHRRHRLSNASGHDRDGVRFRNVVRIVAGRLHYLQHDAAL